MFLSHRNLPHFGNLHVALEFQWLSQNIRAQRARGVRKKNQSVSTPFSPTQHTGATMEAAANSVTLAARGSLDTAPGGVVSPAVPTSPVCAWNAVAAPNASAVLPTQGSVEQTIVVAPLVGGEAGQLVPTQGMSQSQPVGQSQQGGAGARSQFQQQMMMQNSRNYQQQPDQQAPHGNMKMIQQQQQQNGQQQQQQSGKCGWPQQRHPSGKCGWRDRHGDVPLRREMIGRIVALLQVRKPDKLPDMALRLEDSLYRFADCCEDYENVDTLMSRLLHALRYGQNSTQGAAGGLAGAARVHEEGQHKRPQVNRMHNVCVCV